MPDKSHPESRPGEDADWRWLNLDSEAVDTRLAYFDAPLFALPAAETKRLSRRRSRSRRYICPGCGTAFPPSVEPPSTCSICADDRLGLAVVEHGWTTAHQLLETHEPRLAEPEAGLLSLGVEPLFALGQRALHIEGVLFDCTPLLDERSAQTVEERGGIETIAISHPHSFGSMLYWAEEFNATILVHEADRDFVPGGSTRVEYWSGESLDLTRDFTLLHVGGHFDGASVGLWRAGADGCGALFASDVLHVLADCASLGFMWSHVNLLPLGEQEVRRIVEQLAGVRFDRIYGSWWDRVITTDAKDRIRVSASRHLEALNSRHGAGFAAGGDPSAR